MESPFRNHDDADDAADDDDNDDADDASDADDREGDDHDGASVAGNSTRVGRGRGKRKVQLKPTFRGYTQLGDAHPDLETAKAAVKTFEQNELNANEVNGLHFHLNPWRDTSQFCRQILFCPFRKESKCPYKIRISRIKSNDDYIVEIGGWEHSDHNCSTRKRGLPLSLKRKLSPNKLKQRPAELVRTLHTMGFAMSEDLQSSVVEFQQRSKVRLQLRGLEPGSEDTFGGLSQALHGRCKYPSIQIVSYFRGRYLRSLITSFLN